MVQKLHICKKVYFDQLLYFPKLLSRLIPSLFIIVPYLTLLILDFINTIRVSKGWDPDQAQHFVGPDLGPNCLRRLSADDKVAASWQITNTEQLLDTTFWLKPMFKSTTFSIWLKYWLQLF